MVGAEGSRVDEAPYRDEIEALAETLQDTDGVRGVQYPFSELAPAGLSEDGQAALLTVQIEGTVDQAPQNVLDAIVDGVAQLQHTLPEGSQSSYGGQVFSVSVPTLSVAEAVGVVVAFIVLVLTLGSLVAAGMPLLIALVGVGVSMAGVWAVTAFIELTSVTPMLALMLGLAVGIDYTLFIVSRHQEQLRDGVEMRESIARATATSGSAVVFAGLTVIIALVGLFVAGIPFLTALGVAAAAAVAIAVLIALTLTPAVLSMAGEKILPKKERALRAAGGAEAAKPKKTPFSARVFAKWVKLATAKPLLTVLVVLLGLGAASLPALQLRLALPDAAILPADDPARVTYELNAEHFGEGANGPLLLAGSIITSNDPLGLMDDLKAEVEAIDGVREVSLATPNQGADTGIMVVVPETGPHDDATSELVQELRAHHDQWEDEYGVSIAVTGFTAVGIDVSNLLLRALIPFTILVVGLSLVLLALVFRSVWVPVKAALGYLLSVGTALGSVVAVFQWGWLQGLLNVPATAPVLSFMPIILMGVLFGLAMDYEVFLVSRIREEYAHGAKPDDAIHTGFVANGKVVSAAAIIMFAVFAAFVPAGDMSIKTIALGLAVGVFVDAFIVRMTLVPAVLQVLGRHAWWMPRWLDKALPHFDVEGEGLTREIEHRAWPKDQPDAAIATEGVRIASVHTNRAIEVPDVRVMPGEALLLDPHSALPTPFTRLITGRGNALAGTAKVLGLLLPERAATLRGKATVTDLLGVRDALSDKPGLLVLDLRGDLAIPPGYYSHARSALSARHALGDGLTLVVIGTAEQAQQVLPRDTKTVKL